MAATLAAEPFALDRRTACEGTRPLPVAPSAKQGTFWHGMDDEPNQQKLFADLDVAGEDDRR